MIQIKIKESNGIEAMRLTIIARGPSRLTVPDKTHSSPMQQRQLIRTELCLALNNSASSAALMLTQMFGKDLTGLQLITLLFAYPDLMHHLIFSQMHVLQWNYYISAALRFQMVTMVIATCSHQYAAIQL